MEIFLKQILMDAQSLKSTKKLMFALGYFHAAILERRKYGAIGWNIGYMWMNSDLETSKR